VYDRTRANTTAAKTRALSGEIAAALELIHIDWKARMNRKLIVPLLAISIVSIVFIIGCATSAEVQSAPERGLPFDQEMGDDFAAPAEPGFGAPAIAEEASVDSDFGNQALPASQQQGSVQDRLIIRTGNLSLIVLDTEETVGELGRLVEALDGWVVSSNIALNGDFKTGTVTVRVPAEQYDTLVSRVKELAVEVEMESSNSQDVTEEFVDLESRLGNLEATADRVRSFLDETRNVEEALAVNQELSRLESEIEVIKGRMKFLSESAAFSTLTVQLTPDELAQPIEIAGWRPGGVAKSALEALITVLQGLIDLLIQGVIFCLPLALIFGIPAYFVFRFAYRRWGRRKSGEAAETSDEEEA
jgi:hypothetical protein